MKLVIFGAGGHGKVVGDAALEAGMSLVGFVDNRYGVDLLGLPVLATVREFTDAIDAEGDLTESDQIGFIVAVGSNETRQRLFNDALAQGLYPVSVIHPKATISTDATIEDGTYVGAQAVVNAGAYIGENAIINTRATVEHDCVVGAHAFVAPSAVMLGESRLGEGSLLGANATLGVRLTVGEWTRIGEGAVVKEDIPSDVVALGIPAKVVK
jgi:acetyltransferase EpsM